MMKEKMSWCPCKSGCKACGHFGCCKACGSTSNRNRKSFLAYDKEIDDYKCVLCGHWQGKDEQDYLEKNGYARLREIAKIMFGKEKDVMKPISETISKMSMRNMLSDQVVSGFFDKPHSTIADHSNHNYFSPSCKKCNHVMYNHVKYGNTDWHYCKTCLRYKKKSDCV